VITGAPVDGGTGAAETAETALGHDNAAGLRVDIEPSARLRIGERVIYRVRSDRGGYLHLVDVAADGEVTQLFPNKYSDDRDVSRYLEAGKTRAFPGAADDGFELKAAPPSGSGKLVAIVTEDPVMLDDLLDPHRDLKPVVDPRAWLLSLGTRLRDPLVVGDGVRQARWSSTIVDYEIVR